MKVEIHELKIGQKIVLIDLEGKNENVNLKLKEGDFYQVDMTGVREYNDPSLIVVEACIDINQYIEVDLKTLVLATIVTPNGVTTAMVDFRALDGHLPVLFLYFKNLTRLVNQNCSAGLRPII
ncbi:hypothetical protein KKC17_01610 [Patescibacteria group bacterium]|nr:hypothetical protein [Patescibacteria group bacterium]